MPVKGLQAGQPDYLSKPKVDDPFDPLPEPDDELNPVLKDFEDIMEAYDEAFEDDVFDAVPEIEIEKPQIPVIENGKCD